MIRYLCRRLAFGAALLALVTSATFFAVYGSSDTVVRSLVGEQASAEQIAERTAELGLDRPVQEQFGDWVAHAVTGDLGTSYFTSEPVTQAIGNRLSVTLTLMICSMVVLAVVSAVLGVLAAVRRGGVVDRALQIVTETLSAVPKFWLALMLVIALAINLRLFPATGYAPISDGVGAWALGIVLPTAAIVLGELRITSMVRGAVSDELDKPYVRTLRSRGLSESEVLFRHVLRNAAPPWLSLLSMKVVALFSGVVVIEKVFAVPGIGSLATDAATSGDIPILMGVVVTTVAIIFVVYLVFDLVQAWLNPKVRLT
ncbi:ABC transporter permease [Streptomyces sp. CRN 30]|uniref:ABC transporter permease n=1 Tax=Streptomyces sp. CRN 30 TaxID=3075613 RepID=UPI002A840B64|nr:ABC transporter permease [Streptomyces sp. CRN 30]